MNNEIYPNPPAFPSVPNGSPVGNIILREYGMTLRDWFAGKVLEGIFANPEPLPQGMTAQEMAYKAADNMLKERIKNNDQNNEV